MADSARIRLPESHCPACGVGVVAGSSRCPRCHSALPRTSLETNNSRNLWLALIAVAGLAVAGYFMLRGSKEAAPPDNAPSPLATGVLSGQSGGEPPAPTPVAPPLPAVTSREGALGALVRSADNRTLAATFEVRADEPDQVVVISALCGNERLQRLFGDHAAELAQVGFRSLRCIDGDGADAFSRPLP